MGDISFHDIFVQGSFENYSKKSSIIIEIPSSITAFFKDISNSNLLQGHSNCNNQKFQWALMTQLHPKDLQLLANTLDLKNIQVLYQISTQQKNKLTIEKPRREQ